MKSNKKKYIFYILLPIILFAAIIGWKLFGPTLNTPEEKFFYIHTGADYQNVKDSLIKKNILSETFLFDKVALYLDYNKSVKPGKYKIDGGMSLISLIRMLRSGNQSPVDLIITKVRTKEDLAKKIGKNFECDSTAFIHFLNNTDTLKKYDLDTNNVITAIIPNTYILKWNNTPSNIFSKLFTAQKVFWTNERKTKAAALHLTEKQVYTLASIVEEETNKQDDKGKIASVYLNRMRTGMRLAADPTVKFAMKDFGLKRILFKHLSYSSPYNTYHISGLPPGPICTPSIKTIDAVLNAPFTNYLFFVAKADFSGYSNFATGYDEHMVFAKAYQHALDSVILLKQKNQK